jgi:hypothetical protein
MTTAVGGDLRPATLGPRPDAQTRAEVLRLREAAWRTWFGNDQEGFKRVVPHELVAFNWDGGTWEDRAMVHCKGMSEFAGERAEACTSLEFPDNVLQKYGETIILYTTFRVVLAQRRRIHSRRSAAGGRRCS